MRVLVLSRAYPNNVLEGLGLWVERPTRVIARKRNVDVVSPVPFCPPIPRVGFARQYARFRDVRGRETRNGVEVHRPRFAVGPGQLTRRWEARSYSAAIRAIVDEIWQDRGFDLVHAHFVYPDGVAGLDVSTRYEVPLVVTEHAPWHPWLEHAPTRRQALRVADAADTMIAVSNYVAESILRYAGAGTRIVVIPNGVDETEFHPSAAPAKRPSQILYAGVINYNKGIDVLLDAMVILRRALPEARLLLVGGALYRHTRRQEERLALRASELGLTDSVTFLGRRPPAEVARLMAESAVVVLPSRAESFGAVLIEALACGTPVVATRSGGPVDIVTDDVGRLVEAGDASQLAGAISEVLSEPYAYDPTVLREYAVQRFSWRAVAQRVDRVYEQAVKVGA